MKSKLFILFSLIIFIITSCCYVTSQDCGCDPPEPFINEEVKNYIFPYHSNQLIFVSESIPVREQLIHRKFDEGSYFIGGDECGSDFKSFIVQYLTVPSEKSILNLEAVAEFIEFRTDRYGENFLFFHPNQNIPTMIIENEDYKIQITDSIHGRVSLHVFKVKAKKADIERLQFQEFEFIESIGLIAYTDKEGEKWKLKL